MTKNQKIKEIREDWEKEGKMSFVPKLICCGVELKYRKNSMPREVRKCGKCKNLCVGDFVDDGLPGQGCINFIPKRISVEEKCLRTMFGRN
ncbi:hypothetical protein ES695_14365 [Candidatus Atribacteria bacterium 1244-E10-H5-B2]|nr:MAG: hypothetical protein ES695_14365 [Candidatus Atribacteria bacterium 1244-E10-H5-B2]